MVIVEIIRHDARHLSWINESYKFTV